MTNLTDVIELVKAGFTKDEILAMTSAGSDPAPKEPAPAPDPEPEKEPEKEPEQKPAPAAAPKPDQTPAGTSQFDMLLEQMQKLSNQIITNNINTQDISGKPARSDDDILAEVINPPRTLKGDKTK